MASGEVARRADRLGERDDGDGQPAEDETEQVGGVGARKARHREPGGHLAQHGDAVVGNVKQLAQDDADDEGQQGGGKPLGPPRESQHEQERGQADHRAQPVRRAQMRDDVGEALEEVAVGALDADHLGDLLDRDGQRKTEDEAREHRLREELGDAAELQGAGETRDEPGHHGKRGGERHELRGVRRRQLGHHRRGHHGYRSTDGDDELS